MMIALLKTRKKKRMTWTVRKRAYLILLLRLSIWYLRSPVLRKFVILSLRHRRFVNTRFILLVTKGYLLATNSRITIHGSGAFVLPIKLLSRFDPAPRTSVNRQHRRISRTSPGFMGVAVRTAGFAKG